MKTPDYIIEMNNITKKFGQIYANKDLTLKLKRNEILCLLGENGAGKSTLMSILFGLYQPDEGEIKLNGEVVKINNPNDANKLNIGMVHQHFKLIENYTVLDNIILGKEPLKQFKNFNKKNFIKRFLNFVNRKIFKIVDYKTSKNEINQIIKKYGLNVDLNKKISDISVEAQQKVEIIKMLYRENEILIFDEPTAVLTEQEIKEFIKILFTLKAEGKSIIFISHKLNEIMEVSDRIEIIRKGTFIAVKEKIKTNKEELSTLMVGSKIVEAFNDYSIKPTKEVFRSEHLIVKNKETKKNVVNDVSFNVRKGEIVCIAGIDGNGQQELVYSIIGLLKSNSGSLFLNNENITNYSIRKRNLKGIATIPEDRHKHGLVLDYSLSNNLILLSYFTKEFSKCGFLNFKAIDTYSDKLIEKYDIRSADGKKSLARSMSGGNQQKAIIAREIERNTDFLIAVQPTRGLDVGAISNIHQQLLNLKAQGKAILLISLELDQVLSLSDRILVMFEGKIVTQMHAKDATSEKLGLYMSGGKIDEVNAIKKEGEI